jgi:hypothetical protein
MKRILNLTQPLLVSFLAASTFNAVNTLLVDLFPKNSAAIGASNNLTRLVPQNNQDGKKTM